jgi:Magnesium chelatase, subunit ChlI
MLARRLTTIVPAMTLTEAIETTRIHRVASLTGDRTAFVTTRPCCAPHQTLSDAGLIGGGTCRCRARCRWPTMACSSWMNCPSAAVMSWRSCANRSRRVSYSYNLAGVINLCDLVSLANRRLTLSRSGGVH